MVGDGRVGERHPGSPADRHRERIGRRGPVDQSNDVVRAQVDRHPGGVRAKPAGGVAPGAVRDHRAQLVTVDRDLGDLGQMAVVQALQARAPDRQLRGGVEKVRQPPVPDIHAAEQAAVGGVGVQIDHRAILVETAATPEQGWRVGAPAPARDPGRVRPPATERTGRSRGVCMGPVQWGSQGR